MLNFFGILGGLMPFIANIPYLKDIFRGTTKPHRTTWGIFLLIHTIYLGNQFAAGATNSYWYVIAIFINTLLLFLLSLKYGVGGLRKLDIFILIGSLIGVFLWIRLDSPIYSIIANLSVATLGFVPTFKKAYIEPTSETAVKWGLGSLGALFSAISVGSLDYIVLLLPVFACIMQGVLFILIVRKKVL